MVAVLQTCAGCGNLFTYDQITKRRMYCRPCKRLADKASNAISQRMRDRRYGRACRGSIRGHIAQIEQQENQNA